MFDEYKERGVVFLAVNVGDKAEDIKKYFDENKFTMKPVLQKDDEISKLYKVSAYPTNYVVGPDGKIAFGAVGFDDKGLKAALEKLVPKK